MSKKVLAIVSSPRKGGNTETLCRQFTSGAKEAGHTTEIIYLRDKKIAPCIACEACLNNGGQCVQKDDMSEIAEKMAAADVIVLSTPVYYYSMSAQLKLMVDRTLAGAAKITNKEFYFIAAAADGNEAIERTIDGMRGYTDCLPEAEVKAVIYGAGAFHIGDIQKNPAMSEAYKYGRNC